MTALDPVQLQVLVGALRATCEEMGAVLIRSAHSANIKERRDASTALFDGDWVDAEVLGPGEADIDGPAIFELPGATLVVPPGWRALSDAGGVVMER